MVHVYNPERRSILQQSKLHGFIEQNQICHILHQCTTRHSNNTTVSTCALSWLRRDPWAVWIRLWPQEIGARVRTRNLYLHNGPAEKHVPPIIASPKGINVYTPDPQDKHVYKAACECSMPISIKAGIQIKFQMYHVTALTLFLGYRKSFHSAWV
jgi:hypothetical protein